MKALQRSRLIAISILLTILLAACGGTANQGMNNNNAMNNQNNGKMTTGTPTPTVPPATTATPMNNGNNTMGGIAITPDTMGNMAALIHTGKAAINGQMVDILLTNKNFAVYYYKSDTALKATCTGQCAQDWPPVLAPQGMTASSSVPLPKQLSVQQTANGAQVFYDGHALYTYAEDQQPANATGRGEDMLWYLVGFQL
jgi:predicted lipoprotein with Yx(FWY)xxD motif